MNNILISGITGFVGGNLKQYLKDLYYILGVSRTTNDSKVIISYETLNQEHFNSSEAFIHLAGKAHDLKTPTSDTDYFEVNTKLTINLFNQFLESDCRVFIFMSTVKAVADTVEGVLTEKTIPNPKTAYGKSKLKAENYILSKKLPPSKRVYILRPCMIHGPNNKGNLNLLYKIIKNKIPFPLGKFENKRSFLAIENLCFVIQKLISQKPNSGVFNVADDNALSINQLVKLIGEAINKPLKTLNIPKSIIRLLALIGNILSLPLNTERLKKLTENYVVSNKKILKAIESNLPQDSKDGIIETIKSFNNKK